MSLELRGEARTPYLTCTTYVVETPSPTKTNSKTKGELAGPVPPTVTAHTGYVLHIVSLLMIAFCLPEPFFLISSVYLSHGIILRSSECLAWLQ